MAINLKPVDVAVIGLGAAGGVAVLPLARAGLKVAGTRSRHLDGPAQLSSRTSCTTTCAACYVSAQGATRSPHRPQRPSAPTRRGRSPSHDERDRRHIHPLLGAELASQALGFQDAHRKSIKRYGASAIPAGSTLEDWPLTYDDLEPYYDIIEHEVGVSGKAGNIQGQHRSRRQRLRRSAPARVSHASVARQRLHRSHGATRQQLGWNPFRPPAAINSQEYQGRAGCAYHGYCNRGGCHISAKNSTAVTTIPAAMKTKNLTIFDHAHVTRIVADADGRVTGVTYINDGKEYFQPAKVVLLASYTYENSRLLLLSKSKAYPNGLSNNHGQVGRHFFGHWSERRRARCFPTTSTSGTGARAGHGRRRLGRR